MTSTTPAKRGSTSCPSSPETDNLSADGNRLLKELIVPDFEHEGVRLHYFDMGDGLPFVFVHGLGGDSEQALGVHEPVAGTRLVGLDCRGHGRSELGPESGISTVSYADDVRALLDHLGVGRAVVGGVSMGAAVALRFALAHPERLLGLVISRISVLDEPFPPHLEIYGRIAALIRERGAAAGRRILERESIYRSLLREHPSSAASAIGQFDAPRAEEAAVRLTRIPGSTAIDDVVQLHAITVPALVLACADDYIHPLAYSRRLADELPNALYVEVTPKSLNADAHFYEVQTQVAAFLAQVGGELTRC
jgi:pimeloyl-ACP methyl ester carboxylesterase